MYFENTYPSDSVLLFTSQFKYDTEPFDQVWCRIRVPFRMFESPAAQIDVI